MRLFILLGLSVLTSARGQAVDWCPRMFKGDAIESKGYLEAHLSPEVDPAVKIDVAVEGDNVTLTWRTREAPKILRTNLALMESLSALHFPLHKTINLRKQDGAIERIEQTERGEIFSHFLVMTYPDADLTLPTREQFTEVSFTLPKQEWRQSPARDFLRSFAMLSADLTWRNYVAELLSHVEELLTYGVAGRLQAPRSTEFRQGESFNSDHHGVGTDRVDWPAISNQSSKPDDHQT